MIFLFVIGIILPVFIVQSLSYRINSKNMMKKVNELVINNLSQLAAQTDLTLQIYSNILYQINLDDEIIRNVNLYNDDDYKDKAIAYNQINSRLKSYYSSEIGIRSICIASRSGNAIIYDFTTDSSINNIWRGRDIYDEPAYKDAQSVLGLTLTSTGIYSDNDQDSYLFHLSREMFDLNDLAKGAIATTIISIDAGVLNQICKLKNQSELDDNKQINFIIDNKGQLVCYPELEYIQNKVSEEESIQNLIAESKLIGSKELVINRYQPPNIKWTFYNVYDKAYFLKDIRASQKIYISIGIVGVLFSALLVGININRMNRSMACVISGMKQIRDGNLDVVVKVSGKDEIGEIAWTFNEMVRRIRKLLDEVKEATDKQKNAEIRALEAQINPHFLYNTLDSINWMAIAKGEFEISTMLRNLGSILRYSINKSNQKASIEEVTDWIEKYVALQRMRFNDSFDCIIHIDERIRAVKIHKLLLQPFIENAIIHGFKGIEKGGVLHVDIALVEDKQHIQIIIEDNGNGMSREQVTDYNQFKEGGEIQVQGVGLNNVFSRIHMYYGNEATWNVYSRQALGTVITLKLPI